MILEHFTVCYKQSITLQNFVFDKLEFVEQIEAQSAAEGNLCGTYRISYFAALTSSAVS